MSWQEEIRKHERILEGLRKIQEIAEEYPELNGAFEVPSEPKALRQSRREPKGSHKRRSWKMQLRRHVESGDLPQWALIAKALIEGGNEWRTTLELAQMTGLGMATVSASLSVNRDAMGLFDSIKKKGSRGYLWRVAEDKAEALLDILSLGHKNGTPALGGGVPFTKPGPPSSQE